MALVGVRTSIGDLYFDADFRIDHTGKVTTTDHPVEIGSNISDHAYVEPDEVSIEIGVSDSAYAADNFGTGMRSVTAFQELRKAKSRREPLTVVTRLNTYKNMLITSIIAPDDFTTMNAFRATVMLREILMAETHTVSISPRASAQPQKTNRTNSGAKQPEQPRQSVLRQAATQLGL